MRRSLKGRSYGFVLAGGQSKRMGKPKESLLYQGVSLLDHSLSILRNIATLDEVWVSGNLPNYRCLPDECPGIGPLAAIATASNRFALDSRFVFLPVDMPHIKPQYLKAQLSLIGPTRPIVCSPAVFPIAIYHFNSLQTVIQSQIQKSDYSIKNLLSQLSVSVLPTRLNQQENQFSNYNTPQQWASRNTSNLFTESGST